MRLPGLVVWYMFIKVLIFKLKKWYASALESYNDARVQEMQTNISDNYRVSYMSFMPADSLKGKKNKDIGKKKENKRKKTRKSDRLEKTLR